MDMNKVITVITFTILVLGGTFVALSSYSQASKPEVIEELHF